MTGADGGGHGGPVRGAAGDDVPGDAARNRDALDRMFRTDGYAGRLGATLQDWGGGWARVGLEVADTHLNFAGWLHGGVTFSLGDMAFAVASNSWGRLCVALSVDVQFLASASPGTGLTATCRERHRTTRTGAYLIEVHAPSPTDDPADAPLIGSLHALVHRTNRWHLGEDRWSEAWRAAH
jgi:acyl-CoA thioesterase